MTFHHTIGVKVIYCGYPRRQHHQREWGIIMLSGLDEKVWQQSVPYSYTNSITFMCLIMFEQQMFKESQDAPTHSCDTTLEDNGGKHNDTALVHTGHLEGKQRWPLRG